MMSRRGWALNCLGGVVVGVWSMAAAEAKSLYNNGNGFSIEAGESAKGKDNCKEPSGDKKAKKISLTMTADGGYEVDYWQPSFNSGNDAPISYDTEGLSAYVLYVGLGLQPKESLVSLKWARPPEGASRQSELLREASSDSPGGFEELQIATKLGALVRKSLGDDGLGGGAGFGRYAYRVATSLDTTYSHHSFFGSARANRPAAVAGSGSTIIGDTISGNISPLNQGANLNFRTRFESWRGSVNLIHDAKNEIEFRVGYFDTRYRRPTNSYENGVRYFQCSSCGVGRRYVVVDTDYSSKGLSLDIQQTLGKAGNGWSFTYGYGMDVGLKSDVKIHGSNVNLYDDEAYYNGLNIRGAIEYSGEVMKHMNSFIRLDGRLETHSWGTSFLPDYTSSWSDRDFIQSFKLQIGVYLN
ncbi:MAG: hypothetical protein HQL42_11630 [Alphaproteobacteria bacterium]|nr:hypothetical protein [Alphaproteobacteria bacterium]